MGRCGLVVGIGCCGGNHITLAVHSIFTGSILGFHMSEGATEKPTDKLTHFIQNQNWQKTTQKLKRNTLPVTSVCAGVVWLCGLGAGVVATASSLAPPYDKHTRVKDRKSAVYGK